MAITAREMRDREDITRPKVEMLIADGKSCRRIDFTVGDTDPELATDEAFQGRDLVYIIGVNEVSQNNERLLEANVDTLKKQTYSVLKKIAKKYESEIKLIRITGPKIGGIEAYIYHGEILRFITYYKEEQALQKMIYPPNGHTPQEAAEEILCAWNAMKRDLAQDRYFIGIAGRHLNKLGFFDDELVYTPDGIRRRRVRGNNQPTKTDNEPSQEYGPEM